MCVGPDAGNTAVTQTDKVAALLGVTLFVGTKRILLITAAFIC